jgi:hypothetical protein
MISTWNGVHPHDQRLQSRDGRLDGFAEVVQRPFADTVDSLVGDHLGEEPVLPRIARDVSFDCRDSHDDH